MSCDLIGVSISGILQKCPVAKFILFISLYGVGSLLPHLSHHPLVVDTLLLLQGPHAAVNRAEGATPPHTSATVDHNGVCLHRVPGVARCWQTCGSGLGLADCQDEVQDAGTTGWNPVVGPGQKLEVYQSSLHALCVNMTMNNNQFNLVTSLE